MTAFTAFGTGVTSGTHLSIVRMVVSSNSQEFALSESSHVVTSPIGDTCQGLARAEETPRSSTSESEDSDSEDSTAVSYTHLTLPTIYSV